MSSDIEIFAKNLKLFRKGKGFSQTRLAEQIGVTKQSVINYEKGITFPATKRLNRILEVLEATPQQLLGEDILQSYYETKMHHTIKQKSDFLLGYELQIEENPAEIRSYLLNQLSTLPDSELYTCLNYIYDQKIKDAVDMHVSDMVNNTLFPPKEQEWSNDFTVKQSDE